MQLTTILTYWFYTWENRIIGSKLRTFYVFWSILPNLLASLSKDHKSVYIPTAYEHASSIRTRQFPYKLLGKKHCNSILNDLKKSTKFVEGLWAQPRQYKLRLWIVDLHKLTGKRPYSASTARHILSGKLCWTSTLCISKEIVAFGCGSTNNVKVEHLQKGSWRTGATGQRPLLSGPGWSVVSVSVSRLRQPLTLAFSSVPSEQKIMVWSPSDSTL